MLLVVLEPFLVPLFWAVLTGFVLHPYKTKFTNFLQIWLKNVNADNSSPAFITTFKDLLISIDWSLSFVGQKIVSKWKLLIFLGISLPIYHYVTFYPLDVTTPEVISTVLKTSELIQFVTWPLVASSTIAYSVSVLILYEENRKFIFQCFGCLVWFLIGLYVINLFWPPLWIFSIVGIAFYAIMKITKFGKDEPDSKEPKSKRTRFREAVLTVLNRLNSTQNLAMLDESRSL